MLRNKLKQIKNKYIDIVQLKYYIFYKKVQLNYLLAIHEQLAKYNCK